MEAVAKQEMQTSHGSRVETWWNEEDTIDYIM